MTQTDPMVALRRAAPRGGVRFGRQHVRDDGENGGPLTKQSFGNALREARNASRRRSVRPWRAQDRRDTAELEATFGPAINLFPTSWNQTLRRSAAVFGATLLQAHGPLRRADQCEAA
jgi:hypothetical protein